MAEQWTTNAAVLLRAPEFQTDEELGQIDPSIIGAAIENATLQVKQVMQSRFDLSLFIGLPLTGAGSLPESIQSFTTEVAAWVLVQREQRGTSNGKLEAYFEKLVMTWKRRVAAGSLLGDDGKPLASIGGPSVGAYDPLGPDVFGKEYGSGGDADRYGVPNRAIRQDSGAQVSESLERV